MGGWVSKKERERKAQEEQKRLGNNILNRAVNAITTAQNKISQNIASVNNNDQASNSQSARAQRESRRIDVTNYQRKDRNNGSSRVNGGQEMMGKSSLGSGETLGRHSKNKEWY